MKKIIAGVLGAFAALFGPPAAWAGPISLSLSSASDVNQLAVGQTVTFDVVLSGIDPSDPSTFLSFLAANVKEDTALLSAPIAVTPGTAVPEPLNFDGEPLPDGSADAFYDSGFSTPASSPIAGNGIFFSFTVTAQSVGTGTISFTPDSVAATFASDLVQNDQFAPDTTPLTFTVLGQAAAVPAPGALALLLSAAVAAGAAAGRRRLASRRDRAPIQ